MRFTKASISVLAVFTGLQTAQAGPIAYGICQTGKRLFISSEKLRFTKWDTYFALMTLSVGCNTVTVACYAAAGFTFGTVVAAAAAPPMILACNAALGTCSAACATVALFAPTP
ncbi:hypothetical protein D9757_004472 [Collybiopsis confluens]|uniref:Uncharacterized protein n=1 Tax=Collybiopsis confluens TaxID=2823264 RepID=A0A8H5HWV7_9AGAR|nr:hypothetical protein D9757_004472 [Collybiopsis confluens]